MAALNGANSDQTDMKISLLHRYDFSHIASETYRASFKISLSNQAECPASECVAGNAGCAVPKPEM